MGNVGSNWDHVEAAVVRWARFKPAKRSGQQRDRSGPVVALHMMACRSYLNYSLQKALQRFALREPGCFPMLVRFEEFSIAITGEPGR